jgi:hypothetical protein
VAGSTPSSGAACLSVRRLLLVVPSMWVNTGLGGENREIEIRRPRSGDRWRESAHERKVPGKELDPRPSNR